MRRKGRRKSVPLPYGSLILAPLWGGGSKRDPTPPPFPPGPTPGPPPAGGRPEGGCPASWHHGHGVTKNQNYKTAGNGTTASSHVSGTMTLWGFMTLHLPLPCQEVRLTKFMSHIENTRAPKGSVTCCRSQSWGLDSNSDMSGFKAPNLSPTPH